MNKLERSGVMDTGCTRRIGLLALMVLALPSVVSAQEATDQIDQRLRFLEERLDAGRTTALVWQHGWSAVFGVSAVANTASAITADDGDERVAGIVDGVKATGGLIQQLLNPLPARLGAEPMRGQPGATREQRLALGESQLEVNAARAEERWSLGQHLQVLAVNAIGGGVILAFGDSQDALVSAASGILVGEAHIWSQPWRAIDDLRDYRTAFPQTTGWELRPRLNGVELAYRF
jgi:hypothetical protein